MRVGCTIVGVAFFAFTARPHAAPFVQFVSNQSGYEDVTEQVPTAFGQSQGFTSSISHFQRTAPSSEPNWTSNNGHGGGVTTSVAASTVTVSATETPRTPLSAGNLSINYDYVDSGTASVTFKLLEEAQATLTESPLHGQVSVGPLHFINQPPLNNLTGILEPGTYTMALTLPTNPGTASTDAATVTFASVPEPTFAYLGTLAAWGMCRRRRIAVQANET